jgi:hypothetical protein
VVIEAVVVVGSSGAALGVSDCQGAGKIPV